MAMDPTTQANSHFESHSMEFSTSNQNSSGFDLLLFREITRIIITVMIIIGMFGLGCGVDFRRVWKHFKKPTGAIIGIVCQFLIMPALALSMAKILQMNEVRTFALLIIGSCPGGTASNVIVTWLDGDIDLSIAMTTASCILSLAMIPLLLWIYSLAFDNILEVPFSSIAITLASVLGPCILGIIFRLKFPKAALVLLKVLTTLSILTYLVNTTLFIIIFKDLFNMTVAQYISAVALPILGMILGYAMSSLFGLYKPLKLHHYQRRTIAVEVGVQNAQIAFGIINLARLPLVEEAQVSFYPTIVSLSQICLLSLASIIYKTYNKTRSLNQLELDEEKDFENENEAFPTFERANHSYKNTEASLASTKPIGTKL